MNKICKRTLALLLTAVLLFSTAAIAAHADENGKNVLVTVTTDKQSYAAVETASVTVQVENRSGQALEGVVICAKADNWLLARGSGSNVLEVGGMKKGETRKLSIQCVLNRRASGVSFFNKLRLFFRQLLSRPSAFKTADYPDKSSTVVSASVTHGGATVTVTGTAWYAPVQDDPGTPEVPVTHAQDIDAYSDALADLVQGAQGESFVEAKALEDAYYSARILVKTDDLDLTGFTPAAVIEGPDDLCVVQFADKAEAKRFCETQNADADVEFAEPDKYQTFVESYNSWGVEYIEADQKSLSLASQDHSRSVTVAVVDTGVDASHPFLSGRVLSGGYDYVDNDKTPTEGTSGTGHGTHVSGTIVDCTPGLNVKILPVRVLDLSGHGYNSWVAAGIKYAAKNAHVINLSLGGGKNSVVDDAINYAIEQGVTPCVAAGNDNGDTANKSPANVPTAGCICVAAIDSSGNKASFSNYGDAVDICAPGVRVRSCIPGGKYDTWNGTSMATPHVAACAALYVLEHNGASPAQIETYVKSKVLDLGDKGWDKYYGEGVPKLVTGTANGDTPGYDGKLVRFGSYPQTEVKDSELIAALNKQSGTWQTYGYYSGTGTVDDGQMTASDYMRYKDVNFGGNKYRAVTFDSYRPSCTGFTSQDYTIQDKNGYYTGVTYWFRYEPLQWRVLDSASGLVLCDTIIDSQPYNNFCLSEGTDGHGYAAYWGDAGKTYYASNYAKSSIRKWLNDDFYNTAFSVAEKAYICTTTLNNDCSISIYAPYYDYHEYDAPSTSDKIFLLSWDEAENSTYGFAPYDDVKDSARHLQGSDYAKCQGLMVNRPYSSTYDSTYDGNSYWCLRSPGLSGDSSYVSFNGFIAFSGGNILSTFNGIAPALKILDLSSVIS